MHRMDTDVGSRGGGEREQVSERSTTTTIVTTTVTTIVTTAAITATITAASHHCCQTPSMTSVTTTLFTDHTPGLAKRNAHLSGVQAPTIGVKSDNYSRPAPKHTRTTHTKTQ